MKLSDAATAINGKWLEFLSQWQECRNMWRDSIANYFEKEYITPWNIIELLQKDMIDLETEILQTELIAREV